MWNNGAGPSDGKCAVKDVVSLHALVIVDKLEKIFHAFRSNRLSSFAARRHRAKNRCNCFPVIWFVTVVAIFTGSERRPKFENCVEFPAQIGKTL